MSGIAVENWQIGLEGCRMVEKFLTVTDCQETEAAPQGKDGATLSFLQTRLVVPV